MPTQHDSRILQHVATGSGMTNLDVVGLTAEFLAGPRTRPATSASCAGRSRLALSCLSTAMTVPKRSW